MALCCVGLWVGWQEEWWAQHRALVVFRGIHEGRQGSSLRQVPAHHKELLHQKEHLPCPTANRPADVNLLGVQKLLLPLPVVCLDPEEQRHCQPHPPCVLFSSAKWGEARVLL